MPISDIRRWISGLERQNLIELVMTVGVIGMTFVIVALMLMQFTGGEDETVTKPDKEEPTATLAFKEIELGQFNVTMTSLQKIAAGQANDSVSVLQFDASVMVQNGSRSMRVEKVFRRYEKRLHATVDSVTRNATDDELSDPNLKALRKNIRTKVNRLLGDNVVDDVVVSDFRHYRL